LYSLDKQLFNLSKYCELYPNLFILAIEGIYRESRSNLYAASGTTRPHSHTHTQPHSHLETLWHSHL